MSPLRMGYVGVKGNILSCGLQPFLLYGRRMIALIRTDFVKQNLSWKGVLLYARFNRVSD